MALPPLPIDAILPDFLATLQAHSSVLLQAPTGSGKTTRVPPAVLDGLNPPGQVLLLEPRRLAARAAAQRMAQEREQRLGDEVGYQVRFERQASRATRVLVVTPGILLRKMLDDPYLEDVSAILFDEFHERGLESDLALGLARLVQQTVRPELRLVLMSATLDLQPLCRYLGGCPILEGSGRLYPVEIHYRPAPSSRQTVEAAADAVLSLLESTPGDLLVFLPGVGEIRQAGDLLESVAHQRGILLLPLHGDLPLEQQSEALRRHPRRKVVLATNVAETSVTVEGVTGVVDTGLARQLIFDADLGLDRLQLLPISQASAEQRAGRAGRLEPGVCVRLWSEANHRSRPAQTEAEIRRVDLAGALLHLLALGENDVAAFPWPEAPAPAALGQGLELLRRLGAIQQQHLTRLGQEMARLPVHPRLARLMLAGQANGVVERAALVAALLSERSPFRSSGEPGQPRRPRSHSLSDVLEQVEALEAFERREMPAPGGPVPHRSAAQGVLRARGQLLRLTREREDSAVPSADRDEAVLRALLAAYPDRVVKRRAGDPRRGLMVGGRGVRLHPDCAVTEGELFVAVAVDNQPGEALVRQASSIEREWLDPDLIRSDTRLSFDPEGEQVVARKCLYYEDLLLEEGHAALPHAGLVAAELERAAQGHLSRVMPDPDSPGGNLLTRFRCLAEWLPEAPLPDVSEESLRGMLPELCQGCRSFAQVRQRWQSHLLGTLTYEQQQLLDREAPERLEVPSGSQIQLTYEVGKPPVLAVRIQELFGLATTPTLARGRVRVLLHLLGPNYRPQQVTSDLASFWTNTYPQVRKDLRARYPRHSWPDDPLSAPALRGPRRRSD